MIAVEALVTAFQRPLSEIAVFMYLCRSLKRRLSFTARVTGSRIFQCRDILRALSSLCGSGRVAW